VEDVEAMERIFREELGRRRLRYTRERREVFEEIARATDHFDADDLFARLRSRSSKVSRATVYRALGVLTDCGLVHRVNLGDDRVRYERSRGGERHDHLICVACGRVVEFSSAEVAEVQASIARSYGFEADGYSFRVFGRCSSCRDVARSRRAVPAG
jgi:Fur family ferric uptake transcriptional regulator